MDWNWGPADTWDRMAKFLREIPQSLPEAPKALVLISAHWEEVSFTVNTAAKPSLIFDYYGFPEHTYRLEYPAPGDPELARKIFHLLSEAGLPVEAAERGFDHGIFIPMKVAFPEAGIPIVQISLDRSLDPATHLALGRALAPLREEGVLIIGSGMSWHNLRLYGREETYALSEPFDRWLTEAVEQASPESRNALLKSWDTAPEARTAHPREEHLIPLLVVAGAAGDDLGKCIFRDIPLQAATSAYRFG